MKSASDQSTTVLMKRGMKTARGLAVSDAVCSSAVGMALIIWEDSETRKIDICIAPG